MSEPPGSTPAKPTIFGEFREDHLECGLPRHETEHEPEPGECGPAGTLDASGRALVGECARPVMAFLRTFEADIRPMVRGSGVVLRFPRSSDYTAWAALRGSLGRGR